ncbi:hypothetical protein AAVH_20004, partial [Aphelenchoides avenae]
DSCVTAAKAFYIRAIRGVLWLDWFISITYKHRLLQQARSYDDGRGQYSHRIRIRLLCVNFSLFSCIFSLNRRGKAPFTSGFYVLFLLQSCAIYLTFAMELWYRYSPYDSASAGAIGLVRFVLFHSALFFFLFAMTAIALNRLTALLSPARHKKIWSHRSLFAIVATITCLSLLYAGARPLQSLVQMGKDGYWKAFAQADSMLILSTACMATFATNFFMITVHNICSAPFQHLLGCPEENVR